MNFTGTGLVTVTSLAKDIVVITAGWIQQCVDHFEELDDVFQSHFLQGIIFSGGLNEPSISLEATRLLESFGMQWHRFLFSDSGNPPAPGPYVLLDGRIYEPFGLYENHNAAFFCSARYAATLRLEASD